jgi:hypothetical protein
MRNRLFSAVLLGFIVPLAVMPLIPITKLFPVIAVPLLPVFALSLIVSYATGWDPHSPLPWFAALFGFLLSIPWNAALAYVVLGWFGRIRSLRPLAARLLRRRG